MAVPARPVAGNVVDTAWGQVVHDDVVANDVQAGVANVATTASVTADLAVTFPRPFAAAPTVTLTAVGGQNILAGLVSLPTTTGFTIRVFRRDGANLAAGTTVVGWVAYGARS